MITFIAVGIVVAIDNLLLAFTFKLNKSNVAKTVVCKIFFIKQILLVNDLSSFYYALDHIIPNEMPNEK
jgi:hypothetical protein